MHAKYTLNSYDTAADYFNASINYLNLNQAKNNLLIGLFQYLPDLSKKTAQSLFLNVLLEKEIIFSTMRVGPKILITGDENHLLGAVMTANLCTNLDMNLAGVVGPKILADTFAENYFLPTSSTRIQWLYTINALKSVPIVEGEFMLADIKDLDWICDWSARFLQDAHLMPMPSPEAIRSLSHRRIADGNFYKWVVEGKPVSMIATVRRTQYYGIIGYVYTPDFYRGRGYASSIVYTLTQKFVNSRV